MASLQGLAAEAAITIANPDALLAIGLALLFGACCWAFGAWAARAVGFLRLDAPAGEILGVGLACGLIAAASLWAAVWSGGRSSFTLVAVGFAAAVAFAIARRPRSPWMAEPDSDGANGDRATPSPASRSRSLVLTAACAGAFIVIIALLYGSTLSPSPRDGVQPIEGTDIAYYAVLGRDLATTGLETNTLPAGFGALEGDSGQVWYHWGELWLQSALISAFGTAPLAARYLVVLPVVLLAAAAMSGTLVRRLTGSTSRGAYLLGFVACLVLAPIPVLSGPFFSVWAAGMIHGIAPFGLAAVAVLVVIHALAIQHTLGSGWPLPLFLGSATAFVLPAHIVIALLGLIGLGVAVAYHVAQSVLTNHRLPTATPLWWRTLMATAVITVATIAWSLITDHGLGAAPSSPRITAFNHSWRDTLAIVAIGAGLLFTIPIVSFLSRRDMPLLRDACLGTSTLIVAGAFVWGWQLGTFNAFYFFFGAITVFAAPVAAASTWWLADRLRATRRRRLMIGLAVVCLIQVELGAMIGLSRLERQESVYTPIPVSVLRAIESLPRDAKLAYSCQPFEEISFVNSKLLAVDAHTARRIVPMCFQADVNGTLLGEPISDTIPDAGFAGAPQATLFPDPTTRPSPEAVATFLKRHGIEYIYVDAAHPNALVPDAVEIARVRDHAVLKIP